MGVAITIPILFWAHEILCMAILKHTRDVKKNGGAIEVWISDFNQKRIHTSLANFYVVLHTRSQNRFKGPWSTHDKLDAWNLVTLQICTIEVPWFWVQVSLD